ncbi:MAG: hypothetical protein OSB43_10865, partial [Nocardioides sp.]|uniref:hypothetical protein n=2 Tax=Nocardioides sp. TaxID=35761 RepID=UPI00238A1BF3
GPSPGHAGNRVLISASLELDAERMRSLLAELHERLKVRDVKASIYLVGGAAMTLEYGRDGLTPDIDAVISHEAVIEEARALSCRRE